LPPVNPGAGCESALAGYNRGVAGVQERVAAAMGRLAGLRGGRAVHERGRVRTGTLTMAGPVAGVAALERAGPLPVLVRLSRAAGLPDWAPDVHGLAIRLLDAYGPGRHQDLLLDSSPPPPLDRVPLPRWRPAGRYGSLVTYRLAGRRTLIGATLRATPAGLVATVRFGAEPATGTLRLAAELDADADRQVRFDPGSAGPGWEPASRLLRLRQASYRASRQVR
jgi:hypothetical protein